MIDYVNVTPRKIKKDIDFTGWVGSACMVFFSFTFFTPFAIVGLMLLTVQASQAKLNNLVVLNIISIVGFSLNYIQGML